MHTHKQSKYSIQDKETGLGPNLTRQQSAWFVCLDDNQKQSRKKYILREIYQTL